ncbi:trypsin-like serine peptidase [Candidatus Thiothrix anitrata]|uniref:Trypsin-like serine protease n=1 Tax=Candidatus Thiothrix anitrata TaxID=2823902 RepID=A0ABX7X264_9GAMM|nr:trypsin-like serine protease [Candidatus Thiothrix anitrata]QTR50019.1 trypsin-like serine protease [Candidatus Thiothrix anitrata]
MSKLSKSFPILSVCGVGFVLGCFSSIALASEGGVDGGNVGTGSSVRAGAAVISQAVVHKGEIDYANAKALPLPLSNDLPDKDVSAALGVGFPGAPGSTIGGTGNGQLSPQVLVSANRLSKAAQSAVSEGDGGVDSMEYGSQNLPFTTTRVDARMGTSSALQASKFDYYRRAGKLFFKKGSSSYVCSASLIKPGVVVTAAHCVAEFGKKRYYTDVKYVPAYYNGTAPYGTWNASRIYLMKSYFEGTDRCSTRGVVCENDVAVIRLAPQSNKYAGHRTGWFGYGWNGYGFTGSGLKGLALITQLGYPGSHDGGQKMQRTDAEAYVASTSVNNSIMGSRQTGGSSGGPWLVNFGERASLSGTSVGSEANTNAVVGTTSWGYTSTTPKAQGASPFTSNNIVKLVAAVCPTSSSPGCK